MSCSLHESSEIKEYNFDYVLKDSAIKTNEGVAVMHHTLVIIFMLPSVTHQQKMAPEIWVGPRINLNSVVQDIMFWSGRSFSRQNITAHTAQMHYFIR
jgi:hypothetical protein